ncbi:hypothetical protein CDAR_407471 [Caerostris darwini]|uniref:Uncharacterized protein n=1 Tax=Caerostris darwini TaxID=1538125 RepID=A0AAV4Q4L3_9ARAC|nr:hypothetical protein CDAR_407471 [Caerostris darwini]
MPLKIHSAILPGGPLRCDVLIGASRGRSAIGRGRPLPGGGGRGQMRGCGASGSRTCPIPRRTEVSKQSFLYWIFRLVHVRARVAMGTGAFRYYQHFCRHEGNDCSRIPCIVLSCVYIVLLYLIVLFKKEKINTTGGQTGVSYMCTNHPLV